MNHTRLTISLLVFCFTLTIRAFGQAPEITSPALEPYDVSSFLTDGVAEEFSVSDEDSTPWDLAFNDDGTKMYVIGPSSDLLHEYDLSTAYDVSTAVYTGILEVLTVSEEEGTPTGFTFNTDGSKLFVIGSGDGAVVEYALSTAFDISTATHAGDAEEFSVSSEESLPRGIAFNADGSKMFIVGTSDDRVVEYSLSTGFDVSTASHAGDAEEFVISGQEGGARDLTFNDDGTKMYITGASQDIIEYTLGNAFDVSTAVHDGEAEELSVTNEELTPEGIVFNPDGTKLFMIGAIGDAVVEYTLAHSVDYAENATSAVIDIEANDGNGGINDADVTYSLSGEDASLFSISASGEVTFLESPDFEQPDDLREDNIYKINVLVDNASEQSSVSIFIYVTDVTDPLFTDVGTGFDISRATYDEEDEFSTASEEQLLTDVAFSDDGFKMFVIGLSDETVFEYELSKAYDVSTATYLGDAESFDVVSFESSPTDIEFSPTGMLMFITGLGGDVVVEFTLGTAFDVSTATHAGASEQFDLSNEETSPQGLTFNDDGSKMFVTGSDEDKILEYDLSTAYDVSTATYAGDAEAFSVAEQETLPQDVVFNADGTQMFVMGSTSDRVWEYDLGTAYDVSTAVFAGDREQLFVFSQENLPSGMVFNPDGSRLFVVGSSSDVVIEYHIAPATLYTENATADVLDVAANDGQGGGTDTNLTYSLEGDDASLFSIGSTGVITFNASPDYEAPQDANEDNEYELSVIATSDDDAAAQAIIIRVEDTRGPVFEEIGQGYDVSTSVYGGVYREIYTAFEETLMLDFAFNDEGTKLYLLGFIGKSIIEYDLDNPYQIATARYAGESEEFVISSSLDDDPEAFTFNDDGSKLFVIGNQQDDILEYALSTGFDVSTATYTDRFGFTTNSFAPVSLEFNPDGTRLFILNANDDNIYVYDLSTGFDLSTISSQVVTRFSVNAEEPLSSDFQFSSDGTRLVVIGNSDDALLEYSLATAFDLTTATYLGGEEEFSVATQTTSPDGVTFSPNGTEMYVSEGQRIYTYLVASVLSAEENSTDVLIDVDANDGEGGSTDTNLTYTLGGMDSDLFNISTTGELTFESAPDFESPADDDADNAYEIFVIVTANGEARQQAMVISVTDQDEVAPTITSDASAEVNENSIATAYTATADETVTFTLGTSKDESLFTLVNDDEIRFVSGPDFESPGDGDMDNDYLLDLTATDPSGNATTLEITITVIDVDDTAPTITSDASVDFEENSTATAYTATADETVTFSLGTSKDESLFTLTEDVISFNTAPDFESPADNDLGNDYLLDLIATDEAGNESTLEITITVTDIDDTAPSITSGSTASVDENSMGIVYTITADETATFTLGSDKDEALFSLMNDAEISFNAAPDFESPGDGDTNNTYLLDITATDEAGNAATLELTVTVTDVDDTAPTITSGTSVDFEENSTTTAYTATADETVTFSLGTSKDESLFTLSGDEISFNDVPDFEVPVDEDTDNDYVMDLIATDDAGNETTLEITITVTNVDDTAPEITSGTTASFAENGTGVVYRATADETVSFTLGTGQDEAFFSIQNENELIFATAPDFEAPADADEDNDYLVELIATDEADNATTLTLTITVTDVDDQAPTITSEAEVTVPENTTGVVYTAAADETVTFSLGTSKDEASFSLANDQEISFVSAPDFENPTDADDNNDYILDLIATDEAGNTTTFELTILVSDLDEMAPTITSGATASLEENSTGFIYEATADEAVTFTLGDAKDEALFTLANDDEISFTDAPDFEAPQDSDADNVYLIDLIATDAADNSTTLEVSITVTDIDDTAPVITSANSVFVDENNASVFYEATADEAVSFSLGQSKDGSFFVLFDSNKILFDLAPDFEDPMDGDQDNVYLLDLIAADGNGNESSIELSVTVNDVDDTAPVITSGSTVSVAENSTGVLYAITADETATFMLGSSKDEALFSLTGETEISFNAAPDFESPGDSDANNTYLLDIVATDALGNTSTTELTVTVTDIDDTNPVITSATSVDFEENATGVVYTATADEEVTFTLGTDKDEMLFNLKNGSDISFLVSPDFEMPADADANNVYLLDVSATDAAGNTTMIELSINVTDVDDTDQVLSTTSDALGLSVYPNPVTDYLKVEGVQVLQGQVFITDLSGRSMPVEVSEPSNVLDVSGLARGVYLLKVRTDQTIYQQKFRKQ